MIGQYLPNNNETVTVTFRQNFCQLNSPSASILDRRVTSQVTTQLQRLPSLQAARKNENRMPRTDVAVRTNQSHGDPQKSTPPSQNLAAYRPSSPQPQKACTARSSIPACQRRAHSRTRHTRTRRHRTDIKGPRAGRILVPSVTCWTREGPTDIWARTSVSWGAFGGWPRGWLAPPSCSAPCLEAMGRVGARLPRSKKELSVWILGNGHPHRF
jgi:hypothetical protein